MPRSQSALEFVVLASFMLLVILGFFAVISSRVLEAKEEGDRKTAEDVAELAYREIDIAKSVNNGYTRVFSIPETVNGVNYTINITDNRELAVSYLGNEFVRFLPADVQGNIGKGLNSIRKIDGIVYLSALGILTECSDKLDNDGDGNADLADAGCVDAADQDETNCGDTKCEGGENCLLCSLDCGPCTNRFILRNSLNNVMSFDENGNAVLKGTLQEKTDPAATSDSEFIIKEENSNPVAIVNLASGNMAIKGKLKQNEPVLNPTPSSSDFIIKANGLVVAFINDKGDLHLKGTLTQNGNP